MQYLPTVLSKEQHLMRRHAEGNCRVNDKTILGGGGSVKEALFSGGITRLKRSKAKTHFHIMLRCLFAFGPRRVKCV